MASARPRGFNDRLIDDFRAHGGHIHKRSVHLSFAPAAVHEGRKTGEERTSPLAYTRDGQRLMPASADYEKKTARKIPVIVLERI